MLQQTPNAAAAGGNNAQAFQQMSFSHLLQNFDAVGWIVFLTLLVFSVLSIYWIVVNLAKNARLRGSADRVVTTFWETPNAQDAIRYMEEQKASEPFSKIALDASQAAAHHQRNEGSRLAESLNRSEFVDRSLRQAVTRESMRLESGLTVLATVGATAPFVGLLGTVIGIYRALINIGLAGSASIDKVAGPVGEALIMTAIGLLVAVPAVLAYNWLQARNKRIAELLSGFSTDILANINSKGAIKPAVMTATSTQQAAKAAATAPAKPATTTAPRP